MREYGGRIRQVSGDALSAGAVLGTAFPETGGDSMRRSGGAHGPTGSAGLYLQSSSNAGVDRLDHSPPVSSPPPVGKRCAVSFERAEQIHFHRLHCGCEAG